MEEWRADFQSAVKHFSAGRMTEAVVGFERARDHRGDANAEICNNLGQAYRATGRLDDAAAAFRQAADLASDFADPLNNLGMLMGAAGKFAEASNCYRQALRRRPEFPEAHFNLALAYENSGTPAEAVRHYELAIGLRPDYARAISNLGNLRLEEGCYDTAEALFRRAIEIDQGSAALLTNLGNVLRAQGRLSEAATTLSCAVAIKPELPAARWNLAMIQLARGEWVEGWANYRYRNSVDREAIPIPDTPWPADLRGKQIWIENEQGLGDQLFFARWFGVIAARGGDVSCRPDPKLAGVVPPRQAEAVENRKDDICALGDLPFLISDGDIPPAVSLRPDPARRAEIEGRLAAFGPGPYVGISYRAGTPEPGALFKEIPIVDVVRALAPLPVTVINLQRAPADDEAAQITKALGRPAADFTALNNDLAGMLALLDLVDDYVGVSNTNMHLRAGLGKPARVLVTHPAEYRWMSDGDSSPWFADFKLYRQTPAGDWSNALARLATDLAEIYGG